MNGHLWSYLSFFALFPPLWFKWQRCWKEPGARVVMYVCMCERMYICVRICLHVSTNPDITKIAHDTVLVCFLCEQRCPAHHQHRASLALVQISWLLTHFDHPFLTSLQAAVETSVKFCWAAVSALSFASALSHTAEAPRKAQTDTENPQLSSLVLCFE